MTHTMIDFEQELEAFLAWFLHEERISFEMRADVLEAIEKDVNSDAVYDMIQFALHDLEARNATEIETLKNEKMAIEGAIAMEDKSGISLRVHVVQAYGTAMEGIVDEATKIVVATIEQDALKQQSAEAGESASLIENIKKAL